VPELAFYDACGDGPALTNVVIDNGVTSIGNGMFYNFPWMTTVTIPASVTNIGAYAFYDSQNLNSVTISNGVTTIGPYAFAECFSLTNLTMPASVTYIGSNAFMSGALTSLFFAGNAPSFGLPLFNQFNKTVYYLPGTTGWSNAFAGNPAVLWNPLIQASGPNFGVQSNQFGFNITGTSNIPVVVQAGTNLAGPVWTPLQSLTLTNGLVYFSEPLQTNSSGRFYRLSSP
jgi:hypothetical protein